MSRRGRRTDPAGQVQRLAGDADAKRRLDLVLSTLTGERTIEEVCDALGIGPSRFFELKQAVLAGALAALTPAPAGRPAREETPPTREEELQARISELEVELQCALVRTEIALAMPGLLEGPGAKKNDSRQRGRRGPRPPLAPPRRAGDDDAGPAR